MDRRGFGYLRVMVMLKHDGWEIGKKRVYRPCRLEGLDITRFMKHLIGSNTLASRGANQK